MNRQNPAHPLLSDLQALIERGKSRAVAAVNSAMTLTYWHVGKRINQELVNGERAKYGQQILVEYYGKGFETRNLRRMMQFAEQFPDFEIVTPLVSQLSWTHFAILLSVKSVQARTFYIRQAIENRWSKRELQRQIERKAFDEIMVAEYWTELPPKELLEKKLHSALAEVRERLAERKLLTGEHGADPLE